MAKANQSQYPEKYLEALNKCIQSCQTTAGELDALKDCGTECLREIRDNAEQLQMAEKLKAKLFPDRP